MPLNLISPSYKCYLGRKQLNLGAHCHKHHRARSYELATTYVKERTNITSRVFLRKLNWQPSDKWRRVGELLLPPLICASFVWLWRALCIVGLSDSLLLRSALRQSSTLLACNNSLQLTELDTSVLSTSNLAWLHCRLIVYSLFSLFCTTFAAAELYYNDTTVYSTSIVYAGAATATPTTVHRDQHQPPTDGLLHPRFARAAYSWP